MGKSYIDIIRERPILKRLAQAHDDGTTATISIHDLKSKRGQEILSKIHADDQLNSKNLREMAEDLNRILNYKPTAQPPGLGRFVGLNINKDHRLTHIEPCLLGLGLTLDPEGTLADLMKQAEGLITIFPDNWLQNWWPPAFNEPFQLPAQFDRLFVGVAGLIHFVKVSDQKTDRGIKARSFLDTFLQDGFINLFSKKSVGLLPQIRLTQKLTDMILFKRFGLSMQKIRPLKNRCRIGSPESFFEALNLSPTGERNFNRLPAGLKKALVQMTVMDDTGRTAFSLRKLLEKGFFAGHPKVVKEIIALLQKRPDPFIANLIRTEHGYEIPAGQLLTSHLIWLMTAPLATHQGEEGFCHAVVMISLLSQCRPHTLVKYTASVLSKGNITLRPGGKATTSKKRIKIANHLSPKMDAVTYLLAPHLNDIYSQVMDSLMGKPKSVLGKVEPWFLGSIVPPRFAKMTIEGSPLKLVEKFYQAYHPDFGDQKSLKRPVPASLYYYSPVKKSVISHAISIQRIAKDSSGRLMVYFYNPHSNDYMKTMPFSVSLFGQGERSGESSLPFHQFAAILDSFHHQKIAKKAKKLTREEIARIQKGASWIK